jgi:hypothetical protein
MWAACTAQARASVLSVLTVRVQKVPGITCDLHKTYEATAAACSCGSCSALLLVKVL